jgi:hypothetical protein
VFVGSLTPEEAIRLRHILVSQRCLPCASGPRSFWRRTPKVAAAQIARVLQTDENQVRRVIAEFNPDGMDSLRPPTGGGHPRRIDDAGRQRIRDIALIGTTPATGATRSASPLRTTSLKKRLLSRGGLRRGRRRFPGASPRWAGCVGVFSPVARFRGIVSGVGAWSRPAAEGPPVGGALRAPCSGWRQPYSGSDRPVGGPGCRGLAGHSGPHHC